MVRSSRLALSTLVALFALSACDGGGAEVDGSTPDVDGGPGPGPGDVTYYDDIQPLFTERCVGCHQEGSIAPFSLGTYEEVTAMGMGERVRAAIVERIMPPFLADDSGDCNHWSNSIALREEEIAMVDHWVNIGMPAGEPRPAPAPPEFPSLASVDMVLEIPEYTIDEAGTDDYRCFVVDTDHAEDLFVTGYNVIPENEERVHHIIVYNPVDEGAAQDARNLDANNGENGDGYPCFGGPRVDAPPMVLWAPGGGATRYPRGTGISIAEGRPLIVQVHYNNLVAGSPDTDRSRVELSLAPSANQAYIVPLWHLGIELPPGMAEVTQSRTQSLAGLPIAVRIWGAFPHMHTLGRSLRVDINRENGDEQCLIDVPRWDFNWQYAYWLDRPITLQPGDSATITCTYDTRSRRETTYWGDGTMDEMCLNFVYVSP